MQRRFGQEKGRGNTSRWPLEAAESEEGKPFFGFAASWPQRLSAANCRCCSWRVSRVIIAVHDERWRTWWCARELVYTVGCRVIAVSMPMIFLSLFFGINPCSPSLSLMPLLLHLLVPVSITLSGWYCLFAVGAYERIDVFYTPPKLKDVEANSRNPRPPSNQPCPLRVSSRHPPSVRKLLGAQSLQGGLLGVGATALGIEARCSLSASTPPAFGAPPKMTSQALIKNYLSAGFGTAMQPRQMFSSSARV